MHVGQSEAENGTHLVGYARFSVEGYPALLYRCRGKGESPPAATRCWFEQGSRERKRGPLCGPLCAPIRPLTGVEMELTCDFLIG